MATEVVQMCRQEAGVSLTPPSGLQCCTWRSAGGSRGSRGWRRDSWSSAGAALLLLLHLLPPVEAHAFSLLAVLLFSAKRSSRTVTSGRRCGGEPSCCSTTCSARPSTTNTRSRCPRARPAGSVEPCTFEPRLFHLQGEDPLPAAAAG